NPPLSAAVVTARSAEVFQSFPSLLPGLCTRADGSDDGLPDGFGDGFGPGGLVSANAGAACMSPVKTAVAARPAIPVRANLWTLNYLLQ
ncbi:hypothetical protein, partial [Streptomyces purpurascens]|uniref:hypothetical protein n=1 Tax=Streptomyces purpurascens TaxID=1924 RepID=UPI003C30B335